MPTYVVFSGYTPSLHQLHQMKKITAQNITKTFKVFHYMLWQDDPVEFSQLNRVLHLQGKVDHRLCRKRQFKTRCLQKVTATTLKDQTFNGYIRSQ